MAQLLNFQGRVAVVTGAGAGLGRAYALLLAERGAKVVVNDLGGTRDGGGKSSQAADKVVQEIRAKNGTAVADYNSVEDGQKIVETALSAFGRIDILINNAGILRDKSFARISDQDWDLVHSVHLRGAFKTTQAAWPHFKQQGYGRIVMTASNSGLLGNFGQANYSAAKMGLVGLSNTLAIEGGKSNIHCNVIVPTAASRLTEDILPPEFFAELKPELIAPIVAWLCHEDNEDNGSIIESAAGWAGKSHLVTAKGKVLRKKIGDAVSIEDVRDQWNDVTDMSTARYRESIQEASGELMNALEAVRDGPKEDEIVRTFDITEKDVILYALAVGTPISDLNLLYENHDDFCALPAFWINTGLVALMESDLVIKAIPVKDVSLANLLHGEQYLEIFEQPATSGPLEVRCKVSDVLDKGSGAVVLVDVESYDQNGTKVAFSQISSFFVGAGNFGGPRTSSKAINPVEVPKRKPDATIRQMTNPQQAATYRLTGDLNPLHIDPDFAAVGGFSKPPLHGLCSLGFAIRHVLRQYANNDPRLFKALKVRFTKPVFPGETLQTDMWQEGSRIHFQTKAVESNNIVIGSAYVDLVDVRMKRTAASDLGSAAIFEQIKQRVEADPATAKKINAVFLYIITKGGKEVGKWTLDLKQGKVIAGEGQGKADCIITMEDSDMVEMAQGKLNPQAAFMKGKLKVKGNVMLTQKLKGLLTLESKL
ncbi:peroxisomal multifunctional enzyme type 2 [Neocloeon triangulifer]|uniref:peroxisomal multifunctional enzyme type 2 n=1 Tax=Neocloeon triangulifer TaxID=2078957 RepID=UPI00286F30E1|nr:peroxisomal multifunctional enzyme type 2 [Neocloeon triangulifer]